MGAGAYVDYDTLELSHGSSDEPRCVKLDRHVRVAADGTRGLPCTRREQGSEGAWDRERREAQRFGGFPDVEPCHCLRSESNSVGRPTGEIDVADLRRRGRGACHVQCKVRYAAPSARARAHEDTPNGTGGEHALDLGYQTFGASWVERDAVLLSFDVWGVHDHIRVFGSIFTKPDVPMRGGTVESLRDEKLHLGVSADDRDVHCLH